MSGAESMTVLMVVCAVPLVGLALYAVQNLDKPGARGFFLCNVGALGWTVALAFLTWPGQVMPVDANTTIRFTCQFLVVFGWPLLVLEYTKRRRVSVRNWTVPALLIIPVVTVVLAATNRWHNLILREETPVDPAGISELILGPWYLVFIAFAVCLVVLPVGILLSELRSAHGTHRRQILLLLGGWAFGFPGALQTHLFRNIETIPPYVDLTPLAFTLAAGLWGLALFRYQLFSLVPVSRRATVETMADPVIAVDEDRTVVDANPAARELFGAGSDAVGQSLAEFCSAHPQLLEAHEPAEKGNVDLTFETETGVRHFSLNIRPITMTGAEGGYILVLREVTKLREREQELDLLKQVLSRVFRHNVRNDLTVLQGQTYIIDSNDEAGTHSAQTAKIQEVADQLLAHSQKATDMRQIIDTDGQDHLKDLDTVVMQEVDAFKRQHPGVTVRTTRQESLRVRCHERFEQAVQELLQNAVTHFDGNVADLVIEITTSRDGERGVLEIADNGPGISSHEIEALAAGEETALEHSSGVGLWMVQLLVRKSGGRLSFDRETELGGTRVRITLPLSEDGARQEPFNSG